MNGINWGNNGLLNNSSNNFMSQMPQLQMPAPHMEVVKVNGENGANAFQMGPNSSALLLDNNDPIVWFVQTDGAGYKTVTPYDVNPHINEPKPDVKSMEERLIAIDARLKKIEEVMSDESDS